MLDALHTHKVTLLPSRFCLDLLGCVEVLVVAMVVGDKLRSLKETSSVGQ